jgi:hypothetical protein
LWVPSAKLQSTASPPCGRETVLSDNRAQNANIENLWAFLWTPIVEPVDNSRADVKTDLTATAADPMTAWLYPPDLPYQFRPRRSIDQYRSRWIAVIIIDYQIRRPVLRYGPRPA